MKQHFIIVFLVYVTSLVQSLNNSNKCGVRSYEAPLNNASQSLGIFSTNVSSFGHKHKKQKFHQ